MSRARFAPLLLLVICLTAMLIGLWLARQAPLTAVDEEQSRLNVGAPLPQADVTIGQTFIAQHNGLSAVDLLAMVYGEASPTHTLTLRLITANGALVAERTAAGLKHNAPLRLEFPPQSQSAGQTYTLTLIGLAGGQATVWAYSLDGYGRGAQLLNGQPVAGDLRFSTTYTYLWPDALRDVWAGFTDVALLLPALWLLLFAPGQLLLGLFFPAARWPLSPGVRAGLALAISLALLPLLWLWVSAVGLRLSAPTLLILYAFIGGGVILRALLASRSGFSLLAPRPSPFALLLLLTLATRLLAIRDLAFPMWVDSPHHLIIAQVLAATGRVPASYAPILPVDNFIYHFGYHTLLVSAHWLTGQDWPRLMLLLGQVLQALIPLAVYAMVELLTGRSRAAWLGAMFVALISYFPGYYLSWGRYTQLTGALVLAPLLGGLWQIARPVAQGWARAQWREILGLALLIAGMIFIHYRMLFFAVTFALVALAGGGRGGWRILGMAAFFGAVLSAPWLWQLLTQSVWPIVQSPQRLAAATGYNAFPWDYFQSDLERGWMTLALLALAWAALKRKRLAWLMGGWLAVTTALLNIGPGTWLVNNNAWAITLFVPGAALLGWGADEVWQAARRWWSAERLWQRGCGLMLMAVSLGLLAYAGWRGVYLQSGITNPTTLQATAADAEALAWVAEQTPPEAVFVINGWRWLNNTWAGSDGGTWLWPWLGRRTTLPPLDYGYQRDWAVAVQDFNQSLATMTQATAPRTLALWREGGATHIFIGAKGGALKPEMFMNSPHYRLLFSNGAAWVFEIVGP